MIVFALSCAAGHAFEGWFRSSDDFERQREAGQIPCPECGQTEVAKALMAPRLNTRGGTAGDGVGQVLRAIADLQRQSLPTSRWVGDQFAQAARQAAESGESDTFHGRATAEEARALWDDGIAAVPLLVPFVPPEDVH